jgi:uncharacterized protein (TIGR03067 family)
VRPSSFVSSPGTGFALETLTRGTASKPKHKNARAPKTKEARKTVSEGPVTEFEGEWRMIAGVMNGQAMEKSVVQWVKRVTRGSQTTVYAGPQVMMAMRFSFDPSKSPKTIDYINTAGANKGKSQQGIYEFEGNLLKVCVAAPGSPRPAEFESLPGDDRTFTVWSRK